MSQVVNLPNGQTASFPDDVLNAGQTAGAAPASNDGWKIERVK